MTPEDYAQPYPLRIGDHVRIHISGECPARHLYCDGVTGVIDDIADSDEGIPDANDPPEEQALDVLWTERLRGHFYGVVFDAPIYIPHVDRPIGWELFAAVELTPIAGGVKRDSLDTLWIRSGHGRGGSPMVDRAGVVRSGYDSDSSDTDLPAAGDPDVLRDHHRPVR